MRRVLYNNKEYYYHGKGMVKDKTNTGKEISITKAILEDCENGKTSFVEMDKLQFKEKPL